MDLILAIPPLLVLMMIGPILLAHGFLQHYRHRNAQTSVEAYVRELIRKHASDLAARKRELVYTDGLGVVRMDDWQSQKRQFHALVVAGAVAESSCDPALVDTWIEQELAQRATQPPQTGNT